MSHDILVKRALKRREVFGRLSEHLENIKKVMREMDPEAEVFIFGSVVEGNYNYSSDIDILIVTKLSAGKIQSELWKAGIKEPFEIHVYPPERADFFKKRTKLVKV